MDKKIKSRRSFIKTLPAIAATPSLFIMEEQKQQIIHHVFFWLKQPNEKENAAQLIKGLRTLSKIPQVKKLIIGIPASTPKRDVIDNSFHVSELTYFNSVKEHDEYQVHPVHKAFIEKCSHLWEKVIVYDMTMV